MKNQYDLLEEALSSLREEHQSIQAPGSIRMRLAQAMRQSAGAPRPLRWQWLWAPAFALLLALCAGLYMHSKHRSEPRQQAIVHETPLATRESDGHTALAVQAEQEVPVHPHRPARRLVTAPAVKESDGRFLALPSSEGLPPPSMTTLVRIRIRRDDLQQYGLELSPTNTPEIILAEFVVGQDGLSRAVRFVH